MCSQTKGKVHQCSSCAKHTTPASPKPTNLKHKDPRTRPQVSGTVSVQATRLTNHGASERSARALENVQLHLCFYRHTTKESINQSIKQKHKRRIRTYIYMHVGTHCFYQKLCTAVYRRTNYSTYAHTLYDIVICCILGLYTVHGKP